MTEITIPGLFDIHVHFRTPGAEHKEDWRTAAQAAINGGITTVFDMPNTSPACVDLETLHQKKKIINQQLQEVQIPLRYQLYLGADKHHFDAIKTMNHEVVGIKIYMGSSTGGLLMNEASAQDRIFELAAEHGYVVSVHAEDEAILKERTAHYAAERNPSVHSKIRDRSAAIRATEEAIFLAEKHGTRLLIHHLSTKEELQLVREAKKRSLPIYCEVTPHHLFLSEEDYAAWGTKVQMNPPLRTKKDQEALWEGIHDHSVDVIGSDHAPHTSEEKSEPYGKAPSGVPGVETTLPLLLNEVNRGRLEIEDIVRLMRTNPMKIYGIKANNDTVLIDLDKEVTLNEKHLKTKCGWSPFCGRKLKGWPICTTIDGKSYPVNIS